jgi:hypothetical protein
MTTDQSSPTPASPKNKGAVIDVKSLRKPISNFFIKRSLQTSIIVQILFLMVLTSVLTSVILWWFYTTKSQVGSFYYMSNDVMQDLELTNILGIVLPALVAAQAVSLLIAFGIGLLSSRKVAVPIYKIEKWASQMRTGNLNALLVFREKERRATSELTGEINGVSEFNKGVLSEVSAAAESMNADPADAANVRRQIEAVRKTLSRVRIQ